MKVEQIEIKNFKAVGAEKLDIGGRNVYVIGGNGAGKSSFIDAIFKTLTGKDLPAKLVKDGEDKGAISINLGEYILDATFNSKKEKMQLSISSPEGAVFKTPRTMLDSMIGVVDFDLNNFFNLTPKKQVEFIKQLAGVDFSDLDSQYKELFDERTFVNRKVKELEAQLPVFDKSKTEKIDLADLREKLNKAAEINQNLREVEARQKDRRTRMFSNNERLEALRLEITKLEEEQADLTEKNRLADAWLETNKPIDTFALQVEYDAAHDYNSEVDKTSAGMAKYAEFEEAAKSQSHLNKRLSEIEQAKKDAIAEAKLPVPGLSFDEDQLYLNGLPFERNQINTAQLIIAGLQIQLALIGQVRIARFDGSLLDNNSLAEVESWAADNDLQLFVEMVERNGEGLKIEVQESRKEELA